jgi:glycosylphosphatidylinositol transamidase (GPIT) subunit GPI8
MGAPDIVCMVSAKRDEDSYAIDRSREIGLYMIDAFTSLFLRYMERISVTSKHTLVEPVGKLSLKKCPVSHGCYVFSLGEGPVALALNFVLGRTEHVNVHGVAYTITSRQVSADGSAVEKMSQG